MPVCYNFFERGWSLHIWSQSHWVRVFNLTALNLSTHSLAGEDAFVRSITHLSAHSLAEGDAFSCSLTHLSAQSLICLLTHLLRETHLSIHSLAEEDTFVCALARPSAHSLPRDGDKYGWAARYKAGNLSFG